MSDLLLIVVGALAFVSIAAVGLVFAGAGSGSARVNKRAQAIAQRGAKSARTARAPAQDAGQRRKQILKTLQEQEKKKRAAMFDVSAKLRQAGLTLSLKVFWLAGGGFGLRQKFVGGGAERPDETLDEAANLTLRERAHEAVDRAAIDEGVDGGDRLHTQLAGVARVLVDIDLDQLDRALGGHDGLFQRRGQLAARAAPGGPEIDDDRLGLGGLDDVGGKAGVAAFLDQVGLGRGGTGLSEHGVLWWSRQAGAE